MAKIVLGNILLKVEIPLHTEAHGETSMGLESMASPHLLDHIQFQQAQKEELQF